MTKKSKRVTTTSPAADGSGDKPKTEIGDGATSTKSSAGDEGSFIRKLHDSRVGAAEKILATRRYGPKDLDSQVTPDKATCVRLSWAQEKALSPELSTIAECSPDGCTLNAIGHARVLADWHVLSNQLDFLHTQTITEIKDAIKGCPNFKMLKAADVDANAKALGGKGLDSFLSSSLPSMISASVSALVGSLLKWSEGAINRRLKREAIAALIQRLDQDLCDENGAKEALPRTCALASEGALNHVSAGTAQLEVLRSAIVEDLRMLPSRAFVTEDPVLSTADFDSARDAFIGGLLRGESAAVLFEELAADVRAVNASFEGKGKSEFACMLELVPNAVGYAEALTGRAPDLAAAASVLAAMMVTKRCADILFGAGEPSQVVEKWKNQVHHLHALASPWKVAVAATTNYVRSAEALTTGALDGASGAKPEQNSQQAGSTTSGSRTAGSDVNVTVTVNGTAAPQSAPKGTANGPSDAEKGKNQSSQGDSGAEVTASRQKHVQAARAHVLSAIRQARAYDDFGRAIARVVRRSDGVMSTGSTDATWEGAQHRLRSLRARIDLTELATLEDWGRLVAEASKPTGDAKGPLEEQRTALRKLSGLVTAIASESDPKRLLAAVEAAAMPAATWRAHLRPDAFTASLGMHLGLTAAVEWRYGTYGAEYYEGQTAWAAPTLFAPIGVNLTWATEKGGFAYGLFFPVIDPAAFLQYDIHAGGRLPGPRITTVLSPGVGGRFQLGDSALVAMPYFIARPQLRTHSATVSGPGATVFQLGIAFTWDLPFLILSQR